VFFVVPFCSFCFCSWYYSDYGTLFLRISLVGGGDVVGLSDACFCNHDYRNGEKVQNNQYLSAADFSSASRELWRWYAIWNCRYAFLAYKDKEEKGKYLKQ
jgi:Zn-finger protein